MGILPKKTWPETKKNTPPWWFELVAVPSGRTSWSPTQIPTLNRFRTELNTGKIPSWEPGTIFQSLGTELTYRMPFEESSGFPELFEYLEQQPQRALDVQRLSSWMWKVMGHQDVNQQRF